MNIKKQIIMIYFFFAFSISGLNAFDASPPCYRDLELNFFDAALVTQSLSLQGIDQPIWTPIIELLQKQSKNVPIIVRQKAERMNPNPFSPRFIPEVAKVLLRDTLFELFTSVLITYNDYQNSRFNESTIKEMFDYISSKQALKLDRCFPKK